ncbi:MAG: condensation domain-containing protein [Blastocatellia bacterium]|nr:condensation domain-containing protein [Blastocatellia bacterium]
MTPERFELARMLLEEQGVAFSRLMITPQKRPDRIPLSFAQQRLWFLDQLKPGNSAYNIHLPVRMIGKLNLTALQQTISEIVRRHETLRTTFTSEEGLAFQVIAPVRPVALPVVDLTGLQQNEREAEAKRLLMEESLCPFDLSKGPLLRNCLIRLGEEDHIAALTTHHIISDAWSMGVFISEVGKLYKPFCEGDNSPLPELPIQYADYAIWEQRWLSAEVLDEQLAYWKRQLGGSLPVIGLPTDKPRPSEESFNGAHLSLALSAELSDRLNRLSRGEGATLFMTFLAAFKVLLFSYSQQEDIIVGTSNSNRSRAETESLIGFFINTLVLRTDLSGNPTFKELLGRVRKVTLEAFAHQNVPFKKLVEAINPERAGNRSPLNQVKFVLQNAPAGSLDLPGLTLIPLNYEVTSAHCDLTLYVATNAQGLTATFEYSTELFNASTIERMLQHFEKLLDNIARMPDASLRVLSEEIVQTERRQRIMQNRDRLKSSLKGFIKTKPRAVSLTEENLVERGHLPGLDRLPLLVCAQIPDLNPVAWARDELKLIDCNLYEYGAILFRGFKLGSISVFREFAAAMSRELLDYNEGSTPRTEIADKVYTSTEYPADQQIPLHNEMSYSRTWPARLWFLCLKSAERGGETPIADSRKIFQLIDPAIKRRFHERGVMYVRNYGNGLDLSWQQAFRTTSRAEVEAYCRRAAIGFEWRGDTVLRTRQVCQAIATHPVTGEPVWFNQAHLFHISNLESSIRESLLATFKEEDLPRNAYYGDGSRIEHSVLDDIRQIYRENTLLFSWEQNDVLMLDNMLTAHGRMPYSGPRKIVVAMADPFTVSN